MTCPARTAFYAGLLALILGALSKSAVPARG